MFLLKDGAGNGRPMKWGAKQSQLDKAVFLHESHGPNFGYPDFGVTQWAGTSTCVRLSTGGCYDTGPNFRALNGRALQDLEVFRVCPNTPPAPATLTTPATPPPREVGKGLIDCTSFCIADTLSREEHEVDVRRFGVAIAESLKEEQVALYHAGMELLEANDKAAAFEAALLALYGKRVAGGEEDPVVELSVRGPFTTKRFTTLLSTLQACPGSALAARFKGKGDWKVDKDAHGREVIKDCSPGIFSKVLDVLRMRKREGWSGRAKKRKREAVRVAVKPSDRAAFETFVNMQFPGCEDFIMDCVSFVHENSSC